MMAQIVRTAGPLIGAAAAFTIYARVDGLLGVAIALAILIGSAWASESYWRSRAGPDAIRKDLEDRVRNPPS